MTTPTFEQFNYTLRPAKNIERKMMCDILVRLTRIEKLKNYRYIGLGSLSFADFSLFHRRLGLDDMTSIERRENARTRFEFNLPYSNIEIEWGEASKKLREMSWSEKKTICWLDYDKHLNRDMLGDISHVVTKVVSGSVVALTICVDPGPADSTASTRRLKSLRERVGDDRLPPDLKGSSLAKWGLACVCRSIIDAAIHTTLSNRNRPLDDENHLSYQQLFNFHYADGTKMCTVGGIFLDRHDRNIFDAELLDDLEFVSRDSSPFHIETPVLTWRETTFLDQVLSQKPMETSPDLDWIPDAERNKYERVARYAPTFIETELY